MPNKRRNIRYYDVYNIMKRTDIYVTEKQHKTVKCLADSSGITFSEMFRKIIDIYCEKHNDKKQKRNCERKSKRKTP